MFPLLMGDLMSMNHINLQFKPTSFLVSSPLGTVYKEANNVLDDSTHGLY